ncbi:MFS transporter [uncultured Jatrophihabitans sp.]|uniref:MFS transporter n=1 Tax=uncultured Jatrophihabitans sp. TaxID=1610747 RepID=UPI0035C994F1
MTADQVANPTERHVEHASPLRHRVRGRVLLLLCALYAILYFDRVNIATAGPHGLVGDLHLTSFEFGLATSAFALPYAVLQTFGGRAGDRFGARRALGVVAALCGLFTILTGLVTGLVMLLAVRFLLGLSEGAAFATATHAMAAWLPEDRRGFGQGVVHAASRLSNALAPLAVAGLISLPHVGWRGSFLVAGLTGVVWGVLWFGYFRDRPRDHPDVNRLELSELRSGADGAAVHRKPPWRKLARRLAPVTITDFCYGWVLWVYLTWMPSFFSSHFGLALGASSVFASVVLLGGVAGDWIGGSLSDTLLRRTNSLGRARKAGLLIGLTGSAVFILPVLFVHSLVGVTICLTVAFLFLELCNSPLWTIPMDVAPDHSGAASGLVNTGFGVAGVIAAPVFGLLAGQFGYSVALAFSAVLLVIGLVSVRFISTTQLIDLPDTPTPADREGEPA